MLFSVSDKFDNFIFDLIDNGFGSMLLWGILLIVFGLVLLLVCVYFIFKSKNKSDNLLNNVIMQEIIDSNKDLSNNLDSNFYHSDIPNVAINEDVLFDNIDDVVSIIKDEEIPLIEINSNLSSDNIAENIMLGPIKLIDISDDYVIDKDDIVYEETPNFDDYFFDVEEIDENSDHISIIEPLEIDKEVFEDTFDNKDDFLEINDFEDKQVDILNDLVEYNSDDFEEIEDVKDVIVNKDIEVLFPDEININVVHPVRGKDIEVKLLEEEEEIELL